MNGAVSHDPIRRRVITGVLEIQRGLLGAGLGSFELGLANGRCLPVNRNLARNVAAEFVELLLCLCNCASAWITLLDAASAASRRDAASCAEVCALGVRFALCNPLRRIAG